MVSSEAARIDREFKKTIGMIKAKYLMQGKKPPTTAQITKKIAQEINKGELLKDEIIRF